MMQKEEKIVGVLLVMAVLSLIIGYIGFVPEVSAYSQDSKVGERVYVESTVLSIKKTLTGDNLILTLANLNIKVFISKENGAMEILDMLKTGESIRIEGMVEQYKNRREIVIGNIKDIKINYK